MLLVYFIELCRLRDRFVVLQNVVAYGSTYVLVALTIDRHDAIARPMNFSSGGQSVSITVRLAWKCSFTPAFGFLLGGGNALQKSRPRWPGSVVSSGFVSRCVRGRLTVTICATLVDQKLDFFTFWTMLPWIVGQTWSESVCWCSHVECSVQADTVLAGLLQRCIACKVPMTQIWRP